MIPLKRVQLYWREIFRQARVAPFRGTNLNADRDTPEFPLRPDKYRKLLA